MALVTWRMFALAGSPYLMIAGTVLFAAGNFFMQHQILRFWIEAMPLEMYHQSLFVKKVVLHGLIAPQIGHMLRDEVLKPAAERRAAELRARYASWNRLNWKHVPGAGP